ncbi:hypothetical protein BD289DRAFT_479587 [Coniella lustricola]|uniref:Uncharacterized protein n=1 Tax=Coniella lustricola TaxID=2025994 RepID=A0A2T3AIC1_9PEZI|nr:hypothetical protein BD289DRAFT_479587 [Coniella lustricola]
MAIIRLGIIGLSCSAITSWASTAHLPYLLSPRGRSRFAIVALCNSSIDAAKAAIKAYNLDPTTTRAYGDPAALAADADVDLVICCTRVDTHYALSKPSVEAGKHVFIEWPLTHDVKLSRDLVARAAEAAAAATDASASKNAPLSSPPRTVVGLQGQLTPVVAKLRALVQGGTLGKVLSSEVRAFGGTMDREKVKDGLGYFGDSKIGGNVFMIGFAHLFDYVQSVLGEATDIKSHLQLQRPEMKLTNASGTVTGSLRSDVPDLIAVTASLTPSRAVQQGATLQVRFRRGQPFKGEPALAWWVNCEHGEIRLLSPAGTGLHADAYARPVTIDVHRFGHEEASKAGEEAVVSKEEWTWLDWQEDNQLPLVARSVAQVYDEFYEHVVGGKERSYPDFGDALRRHEQLASMLGAWEAEL